LCRFFFATITQINEQIHGKQNEKSEDKGNTKQSYVWEQLIHYLSKEFSVSWEEVTSWNIFTFNHRLKFINFTKEKEINTIQRVNRK